MASPPLQQKPSASPVRMPEAVAKAVFLLAAALCLTPWVTAPVALLGGILLAQITGNPFPHFFKKYKVTARLLQYSVVGLGFGMNIGSAIKAGSQGVLFTIVTIMGTLLLGALLGYLFKIDRKTTHLISSGTAICGGSAIAAIAPVVKADERQITVALGIVFILNSVALFLFPVIGEYLKMTAGQFGMWCAIAIHDTSSVVGAATHYDEMNHFTGENSQSIATVVKLARALWIIPLALGSAFFFKDGEQKIKIPWFIAFFILAMLVNTYMSGYGPGMKDISAVLVSIAKKGLVLTLFFIGASLSMKTIRSVGFRPLLLGLLLWLAIAGGSLFFILKTIS